MIRYFCLYCTFGPGPVVNGDGFVFNKLQATASRQKVKPANIPPVVADPDNRHTIHCDRFLQQHMGVPGDNQINAFYFLRKPDIFSGPHAIFILRYSTVRQANDNITSLLLQLFDKLLCCRDYFFKGHRRGIRGRFIGILSQKGKDPNPDAIYLPDYPWLHQAVSPERLEGIICRITRISDGVSHEYYRDLTSL